MFTFTDQTFRTGSERLVGERDGECQALILSDPCPKGTKGFGQHSAVGIVSTISETYGDRLH